MPNPFLYKWTFLFQTIQFSSSTQFLLSKTFLFQDIQFSQTVLIQTIQFSISMHFSLIWPIYKTLSGATTPGQSGSGSNVNDGLLHIPQSFSITGTSPSDCLVSYPGQSLGDLTPLQRCSRCLLQPQMIWQYSELKVKTVLFQINQLGISIQFKCQNTSILSNLVQHK